VNNECTDGYKGFQEVCSAMDGAAQALQGSTCGRPPESPCNLSTHGSMPLFLLGYPVVDVLLEYFQWHAAVFQYCIVEFTNVELITQLQFCFAA